MKPLYPLAKRFIAGHDFDSAKPKIDKLMSEGFEVSIDYLGELSASLKDCEEATVQYLDIIRYYNYQSLDISIKPSQLGLLISPTVSYGNLRSVAKEANKYGHTIRLDMEDSRVTELTRNQAISLNKKYGNVGVAMQSNLYRTEKDLKILTENKVSVRLVKGAYRETREIAYQDNFNINANFFHLAAQLYADKANSPAVATHDEELLEDIRELIPDPSYFDYEFLYGIRRDLQKKMRKQGQKVRIYIPFGTDWLPYTMRRLKEWKNLTFVIKNILKESCN